MSLAVEQDPATVLADEYARALLESAEAEGLADTVAADLSALAEAVRRVPGVDAYWLSPLIPADVRAGRIGEALAPLVSALTLDFLRVLVRNGRGALLGRIGERYERLRDLRAGKVEVIVTTAVPLDEPMRRQVASVLAEALDAEPRMELEVDPDVLGGMTVRIGDRVIDASVAGALDRLRAAMIRRGKERLTP
ncbi:MAG TPA: ATP synthase F1 subunit delta [Phycisphaerae bacterium]|nr:ATP synthase F1 subunit delta [Phycisphaerae bacterium]